MHERIDVDNLLLAVIFSSLGIVFPLLFHLLGLGSMFLPMYIPLALGSFLLTASNALLIGFFTPFISALITGMPPFYPPVAFIMMAQLAIFCFIISFTTHRFHTGTLASFCIAIIADRSILALCYCFIMPLFSINPKIYIMYDLFKGMPGIIIMMLVLPFAVPRSTALLGKYSLRLYENRHEEHHEQ